MDINNMDCCGMREIDGLASYKTPEEAMTAFILRGIEDSDADPFNDEDGGYCHVVFSQGVGEYGNKFAAFIRSKHLGTVKGSRPALNPNTGNIVTAWIWTLDRDRLKKWSKANVTAPKIKSGAGCSCESCQESLARQIEEFEEYFQ